jgi:hypothetical protein
MISQLAPIQLSALNCVNLAHKKGAHALAPLPLLLSIVYKVALALI